MVAGAAAGLQCTGIEQRPDLEQRMLKRPVRPALTSAVPESGRSSPRITRIVVDLPAPFGPAKPVTRPGSTVKVIPSSARTGPYRFLSS